MCSKNDYLKYPLSDNCVTEIVFLCLNAPMKGFQTAVPDGATDGAGIVHDATKDYEESFVAAFRRRTLNGR